jgi:hypothetical protein
VDLGTLGAVPSAWRGVVVWDLAVGSTVAVAWEASAVAKPKALPCLREPNKVRNRQKSQAPIWSRNRWLHFLDGGRRLYPFPNLFTWTGRRRTTLRMSRQACLISGNAKAQ